MSGQPFVSCICPTYNRRRFLPYLIYMFEYQEWPKEKRELIILDDSPTSNQDIIDKHKKDLNIKYIYSSERINLGEKRNQLNNMAKGEYIFCLDDDDYYPPQKIKIAINRMRGSKKLLSGCSILYTFYTSLNKISIFGPYGPNHCTNGTMAYHRDFLKNRSYESTATKAEEKYFLKNYSADMVQLNPLDVIICISHDANTIDKRTLLNTAKDTEIKLKQYVKDKKLMEFYNTLIEETKNIDPVKKPEMKNINQYTLDLDAIENGYLIMSKEIIENQLNDALKKKLPVPIINRFEKILKNIESGKIKTTSDIKESINLDSVLEGNVKVSKDYINILLEKSEKQELKFNDTVIEKLKEIQLKHQQGLLDTIELTAINEYKTIFFSNQSIKQIDEVSNQ